MEDGGGKVREETGTRAEIRDGKRMGRGMEVKEVEPKVLLFHEL